MELSFLPPTNNSQNNLTHLRHLTSEEVMTVLNISKNTLPKLRDSGDLVYFKTGRFSYSYPQEQFTAEYIKRRKEVMTAQSKLGLRKG